jgi:hypothetical protein
MPPRHTGACSCYVGVKSPLTKTIGGGDVAGGGVKFADVIRYRWKETPGKEKTQLFQHQSNEVFARNVASFRKNSKNLEKKTCLYLKFCQTVLTVA